MITRNKLCLLLLLTFLAVFQSLIYSQNKDCCDWKLVKNQNDIKVFLRKHKGSNIKEALGVMEIKTSLSSIIALLKDAQNHKTWMYANKKSSFLKSPNDFEWILHTESEAPWPVLNRDLISHAKMYQSSKNCAIKIKAYAIPDYISRKNDLVRIEEMNSEWVFTPKKNGFVEIRFKIMIDLGGNLPPWIVNLTVDKGPYSTLYKMKKAIANKKYQQAKLLYLRENCNMAKR